MKLIAGGINGQYLLEIHSQSVEKTDGVKAAIAYANGNPSFFKDCRDRNIKLTFWGRYDQTVPVATPILKSFLDAKSPNFVCKLVPDIFHPKVIWWGGYGVYIGSANLTHSGWYTNVELGIFLTEDEIVQNALTEELDHFFEEIDKRSWSLTREIYEELCELENINRGIDNSIQEHKDRFNKGRVIPPGDPLTRVDKKSGTEKRRTRFLSEWQETLQILRDVADRVTDKEYRPDWIHEEVPKGVQADQFLHGFYYSRVKTGTRSLHYDLHANNKDNPEVALIDAMKWWKGCKDAPHSEKRTIYEWAEYLRKKLDKKKLLDINEQEFVGICYRVHAMRDHFLRVKHTELGSAKPFPQMNADQRVELVGKWLFNQVSESGKSVLEVIFHVLYGGDIEDVPGRIWEATENPEWRIAHLGVSSLGEMTGWAIPDIFPPRNGRTSKALTALGYNVRIHSE